jgi:hypothetical protein
MVFSREAEKAAEIGTLRERTARGEMDVTIPKG